jgi:hypothetical protein
MVFQRDIDGTYEHGVLKWTDKGLTIPIINISLNNIEKSAVAEFDDKISLKDSNVILLAYDGKDYRQLKVSAIKALTPTEISQMTYKDFKHFLINSVLVLSGEINTAMSSDDMLRDIKIGQLVKKSMIKEPKDSLKTIMEFLFFAMIVINLIAIWYLLNESAHTNAPTLKAINATLNNVCYKNEQIQINQTATLTTLVRSLTNKPLIINTSLPSAP